MPSPGRYAIRALMYRLQILILDPFLAVRERQEFRICPFELLASQLVTQLTIPSRESVSSRVLSEDDQASSHTDALGLHDLVGDRRLEHTVLMDSRLMGESVVTDDCFVDLHGLACEPRQQLARRI